MPVTAQPSIYCTVCQSAWKFTTNTRRLKFPVTDALEGFSPGVTASPCVQRLLLQFVGIYIYSLISEGTASVALI